ncbi:Hsp70 family protein [Nocardia pseudobrasiliensis]|uniref:Hsp70 protein n=1 Tax=Nocardia pseudobrasiliensis TaxID=45979 RepID=A0A370ICP7_9NOCA|nr:Hsp70 family protein [Nocardia pseudobrasiliensis]RDI67184.1 Hsp70 protein [Nocardia pseudobrasiliensis]
MVDRTAIAGVGMSFGAATTVFATVAANGRIAVDSRRAVAPNSGAVFDLLDSVPSGAGVVVARSGARDADLPKRVRSLAEPLAAVEWFRHEHGPLSPGRVLVYDLGATSLDVAVVQVGPDGARIIGTPARSLGFGGIPLGASIVENAASPADYDDLRAAHIRASFTVIHQALRAAQTSLADIDRILVVGGASRAPEVAATLSELERPVLTSTDPADCLAIGAALHAARRAVPMTGLASRRPLVLAGATVVSVLGIAGASLFLPASGTSTPTPRTVIAPQPVASPGTIESAAPIPAADVALKEASQQGIPEPEPSIVGNVAPAPIAPHADTPAPDAPNSDAPPRHHTGSRSHHGWLYLPWRQHR